MFKALKLELNNLMERKLSLLFYLIIPAILIAIFYYSATAIVTWGKYVGLNIKIYDWQAPFIFAAIVLFFTVQLTILRIVGERAPYGTLDRELVAISKTSMYFGKLIANFIFVFIQIILIYIAGFILFPARNYGNSAAIFLFLLLIGLFGLVSGLAVSIFSKNKEQAIQFVPFFVLVLLLLSGVFVPLEQMSEGMKGIASILPLTLGSNALNSMMLDGWGFEDVTGAALGLIIWIIIIITIGLLKFKYEN